MLVWVLAMALYACLYNYVPVSVIIWCSIETDGWNNLVFGVAASFDQSYTAL